MSMLKKGDLVILHRAWTPSLRSISAVPTWDVDPISPGYCLGVAVGTIGLIVGNIPDSKVFEVLLPDIGIRRVSADDMCKAPKACGIM